jgi:hypothetical protein
MNWRGTLGLFVALTALAGAYVYLQWRGEETVREVAQAKRLFDFEPAAITKLSIRQVDQKAVVAERAEAGWKITEPNPTIPPFVPLWERVCEHLAGLVNERSIDPGALDLAQYGLDVPALEVNANAGGRSIALTFGKLEPTQENRYALLDGKQMFLVSKNQFFELNRALDDLRNKFTVDDREANILRLEFAQIWTGRQDTPMENPPAVGEESPPVILARESATAPWKLVSPRQAAANQELVEAIVKELQFGVGYRFVDDVKTLADYGLQPARFRMTVVDDRGGRTQTFLFGDSDQESGAIYVQRPDRDGVFMMDPQVLTLLPSTPDAFQERRLLTHQAMDYGKVVITHKGEVTELNDVPEKGWVATPEDNFETDQAAVSTYITALKRAMGERILLTTPEEIGLAEPETRIQLFPRDGSAPSEIRIQSKWDDPAFAVALQDLGSIMTVPTEMATKLQVDPLYFRSRRLWKFNPTEVTEVALTLEGTAYRFKRAHDAWAVVEPAGLLVGDGAAVDAFIKSMAELRVISPRPEAEAAPESFGLVPPTLQVTLTTNTEEGVVGTTGPLDVGGPSAEQMLHRFARLAGQPGIYRIEQKTIDATREFIAALQKQ